MAPGRVFLTVPAGASRSQTNRLMIPEYNKKSLRIGIPGFVLVNGCPLLIRHLAPKPDDVNPPLPDWVPFLLLFGMLAGAILLIIGLGYYAKAKGYSAVLGLLGLLSCVGVLILAVLPDREPE